MPEQWLTRVLHDEPPLPCRRGFALQNLLDIALPWRGTKHLRMEQAMYAAHSWGVWYLSPMWMGAIGNNSFAHVRTGRWAWLIKCNLRPFLPNPNFTWNWVRQWLPQQQQQHIVLRAGQPGLKPQCPIRSAMVWITMFILRGIYISR